VLEAMACGVPSIVPHFGAALDFCDARTSYRVPVRRIRLPVGRDLAFNTLGFRETVASVDFCEIDPEGLAAAMRAAFAAPAAQHRARGRAAAARVRRTFRWADSVRIVERHLRRLAGDGTPVRVRRVRAEHVAHRRRFEVARTLYLGRGGAGGPA
jgi:glycosyltransferase involved in cell wall biosynthesis